MTLKLKRRMGLCILESLNDSKIEFSVRVNHRCLRYVSVHVSALLFAGRPDVPLRPPHPNHSCRLPMGCLIDIILLE